MKASSSLSNVYIVGTVSALTFGFIAGTVLALVADLLIFYVSINEMNSNKAEFSFVIWSLYASCTASFIIINSLIVNLVVINFSKWLGMSIGFTIGIALYVYCYYYQSIVPFPFGHILIPLFLYVLVKFVNRLR